MAVAQAIAEVFRQHAKNPSVRQCPPADLERRLLGLLEVCRAAWPGLGGAEDVFVRHLAENLPQEGDLESGLSKMHGPDLYLASSCAAGDPAALAAFDHGVLSQSVAVLRRMGLSDSRVEEVIQVVRTKLLVADDGRPPLLASYAGRGALVGWVRTVTRRTALSMRRNKDEQIGEEKESGGVEDMPLPADMELDYIKTRYRAEFKQAVEDAIATLGAEQLKVLRLHYTDRLSIDSIAALLHVHRATAARWIRAAADTVRTETRRLLHERLRLSAGELDSLAGLVQSQLHLSLDRLLGK
jgi:RNA polymerase sigma-70 factor (ECF subfamily)